MLEIKITKNEVEPAIIRLAKSIAPRRILKRALVNATAEVKRGYSKKFFSQMLVKASERASVTGRSYTPGKSRWQQLKGEAGFHDTLGMFTGTTYKSIGHRITSVEAYSSRGEVSLYGRWPKVTDKEATHFSAKGDPYRIGWFFTETVVKHGVEVADTDRRAVEDFRTEEEKEIDAMADEFLQQAESHGDDDGQQYGGMGITERSMEGGLISVGPGGAKIQYPGSRPFRKPSEDMKTKKYGPYKTGIDFMYLNSVERDKVMRGVVNLISSSMARL